MKPPYTITTARPEDVGALGDIERAAAVLLKGHAPASVLEGGTDVGEFREAQEEGRLWVARIDGAPVGFALVEILAEDLPHLEEIDVDPPHGRIGIGTALVRTVCDWASRHGYREITLTTFRAVPWNMPFYERLGFEEVPAGEVRPEIAAVVQEEARRGLNPGRRVVMRWRTGR